MVRYYLATYGFVLAALGIFVWIIGYTARFRLNIKVLIWYLLIEAVITFFGLIPSKVLLQETYVGNPFSFSLTRLSTDIFVVLSALGMEDFAMRDALYSWALVHPWLLVILWLTIGILLISVLIPRRFRVKSLAGLVWLMIALAPLRGLPANFFTLAGLYLATPIVAMGIAFVLIKIADRSLYFAMSIGIAIVLYWSTSLWVAQENLKKMGRFSDALHAILQQDSKDNPGPLRVIVNVPDPFRIAGNSNMAHFLVFRIVQSALQLGGYSKENVSFVEGRIIQIVAVDYGAPCNYESRILDNESILISTEPGAIESSQCISQLRPVDFNMHTTANGTAITASRRSIYSGYPLSDAEVYAFDGRSLRHLSDSL